MITLIIPVYNCADGISALLSQLSDLVSTRRGDLEICIVDDGSTDGTGVRLQGAHYPWLKVIGLPRNQGKGTAVATGVQHARGHFVFFTDADLPYDLSVLDSGLAKLRAGADVVAGSRALSGTERTIKVPFIRQLSSVVFSFLANTVLLSAIPDTQCGFKGFTRPVAQNLFQDLLVKRYCFDVEILYRAQAAGYHIAYIPVRWVNNENSSISLGRDSINMFSDLVRLYVHTRLERLPHVREFGRYVVVGIINTLLNLAIFNLFIFSTGITRGNWIIVFSLCSYAVVITQAYVWNKYWVFKHRPRSRMSVEYGTFVLVASGTALLGTGIIYILVNVVGAPLGITPALWANIAVLITIPVSLLCNFFGTKLWVFRSRAH
jgi:dolichyl-phosphate beta-glucosyltransferase